jgi:hypothetical protein
MGIGWLLDRAELAGEPQGGERSQTLLVTDGVVGVRTRVRAPATALLEGVDLATGKHLWTNRLADLDDNSTWRAGIDIYFSGYALGSSMHPFLDDSPNLLFDIDARTGREQGRVSVETMTRAPMKYRGGIILHDVFDALAIDSAVTTKIESVGFGCVVGEDYWRLARLPSDHYELRTLDDRIRISVETEDPVSQLVGCATFGEGLVFFLQTRAPDYRSQADIHTEIQVYDRDRQRIRRLTVGELRNNSLVDPPTEASHAFGALARFLPLLVADTDFRSKVVMVDLREGRIQWEIPGHAFDHVFRVDGRWYLSRHPRTDRRLRLVALFDGETGLLDRAVQIWGLGVELREITDNDVGGGSLWVVAGGWVDAYRFFARLDATTLEKVAGSPHFEIADATNDEYLAGIPHR